MSRRIEVIEMPLAPGTSLLHPQSALLSWSGVERKIDIGQLCYLQRDTSSRQRASHQFDISSLAPGRIHAVAKLITCLSELQTNGGMRPLSVQSRARVTIQFANWADQERLPGVLASEQQTLHAMETYFAYLRDQVSRNQLNKNTGANTQRDLRATLADFFANDDFGVNVPRMRSGKQYIEHTEVPDETSQGLLLAWANVLFDAISRHVLQFEPYPFTVRGPSADSREELKVWMFPYLATRRKARGFNHETGEVRSYVELRDEEQERGTILFRQKAYGTRAAALGYLKKGNSDHRAKIRISHANLAANCFAAMFLAETGMNLQVLLDLHWSPTLVENLRSKDVVRQGFREVKYRAGGKVVTFQVTVGFLPKLRRFLDLRNYLLQGGEATQLFIMVREDGTVAGLPTYFVDSTYKRFETLGIKLPQVNAREWRAAKSDWAVRKHGPIVSAKLLGVKSRLVINPFNE